MQNRQAKVKWWKKAKEKIKGHMHGIKKEKQKVKQS